MSIKTDENAWSKYQMLVMQQLEDYGKVLQNMNLELSRIRESFAVLEAQTDSWKEHNQEIIEDVKTKILELDQKLESHRTNLKFIEKELELDKRIAQHEKTRARWMLIVSLLIALLNVVAIFIKK